MKHDAEHEDWKLDAPYLASLPRVNPFAVPDSYFQDSTQHISRLVWMKGLQAADNHSGFVVPANYFSSLTAQLSARVLSVSPGFSLNEEFTGLNEKAAAQMFTTPTGYFESLNTRIQLRLQKEEELQRAIANPEMQEIPETAAKTTVLKPEVPVRKLWQNDWVKYASAACIILITAFGLFLNQQQNISGNVSAELANEQLLYDIPEEDIIDHILNENPDQHALNTANTDLENYLINNYSQSDLTIDL